MDKKSNAGYTVETCQFTINISQNVHIETVPASAGGEYKSVRADDHKRQHPGGHHVAHHLGRHHRDHPLDSGLRARRHAVAPLGTLSTCRNPTHLGMRSQKVWAVGKSPNVEITGKGLIFRWHIHILGPSRGCQTWWSR